MLCKCTNQFFRTANCELSTIITNSSFNSNYYHPSGETCLDLTFCTSFIFIQYTAGTVSNIEHAIMAMDYIEKCLLQKVTS